VSQTTRLALVGYGSIAARHLEVFRALGAEVTAGCNRSEAGRRRAREDGGLARTYASAAEMIEREDPAGLLVTVSALSVGAVVRELLPFGRPILAEKPPGTSLAEARELAGLASAAGVTVMVGLNRRFYSVHHRAVERMGGRAAITRVAVEWSEDPLAIREHGHPPELIPVLNFANSLHGIDLLTCWAGSVPPWTVWGRHLDRLHSPERVQMGLDGLSERGVQVHLDSTWDAPVPWRLIIEAAGVRLVSTPLETARLSWRDRSENVEPDPEDRRFKAGFFGQASTFLRIVREKSRPEWPSCTLDDSLPSMALAEALTVATGPWATGQRSPR
jgi:predicted dehydrogenase